MKRHQFTLLQDKYRKNRGGRSHFLNLFCTKCGAHLMLYQKDGFKKQWLKRLYLDRIFAPSDVVDTSGKLICKTCKTVIGLPMIYEKESRPAVVLIKGTFIRRPSTGIYPHHN